MKNGKLDTYSIIQGINFEAIKDHPNILIAAGFWEEERFQAAKVCYQFMRKIDDLIDNRKALGPLTPEERSMFVDKVNNWIESLNDISRIDSSMKHVTETISKFKIPSELFRNFAGSMIYDISHDGFATYNSFIAYAEGASVAPASIFVHLCCLSKKDDQFISPSFDVIAVARPCALFSYLVHIIRDFQKDQNNNLNYFTADILKKHNLAPEDLKKMAQGKPIAPKFRNVIREYYNYAEIYKRETIDTIEKIKDQLEDRYTLSLYIIFELYLQVFERIDIEKGKFTTEELNPTPTEIKERVMRVCS